MKSTPAGWKSAFAGATYCERSADRDDCQHGESDTPAMGPNAPRASKWRRDRRADPRRQAGIAGAVQRARGGVGFSHEGRNWKSRRGEGGTRRRTPDRGVRGHGRRTGRRGDLRRFTGGRAGAA